ncbi:hypothetical protein [Couchioplanes caeruleus]|uniref:Uncharacterized protein n=2 Tax=Couchioplanes caeruleus TaxID=56438 RepID=A0A1K0GQ33_9ACTN|nr:hypothetical protein [Couchioplanes caeruleus]OJF14518.1 hypothetical protein BG844_09290 [Couchioplanes caeruleus subsp. caeruleus]ROP21212.1 hypothetical protein EDD30_7606 [Couchioplanes caeruleus]
MPRDTTPKAISSKAERQALELLRARAAGIGEAAVLRHRVDELTAELTAVTDEYAAVLAKLRENGWSDAELKQLGLTEVTAGGQPAGRRRQTRVAAVPAPRDSEPTPSATPHLEQHPEHTALS